MISACLICYNEEELLPYCLDWLNSIPNIGEICIVDSFSTDKTWDIIKNFKTNKIYKYKQQVFTSFGKQKNDCVAMATGNWILMIDADETYSHRINNLLADLNGGVLKRFNAIRIMTFITWPDRKHYINPEWLDPHIRLWKKGTCRYRGDCHEQLWDILGRNLHGCYDRDILTLSQRFHYEKIVMLHHQRLKSKFKLLEKGQRWKSLGMLEKSAQEGLPVTETSWADYREELVNGKHKIYPIHPDSWDYK